MLVVDQHFTENVASYCGDSVEIMRGIPTGTMHHSVFSPPFSSLYTHSSTERDMGNTRSIEEFFAQYRYMADELVRIMMPGRKVCVHIQDLQATVNTHGVRKLQPFALPMIEIMEEVGFNFVSMITIWKNPQKDAARNKVHELMFATKKRDAAMLRPVLPEYLLVFNAPGKNPVPIVDPIDNETWIKWASDIWPGYSPEQEDEFCKQTGMTWTEFLRWSDPCWFGIRETEVLNTAIAKADQDERHLCPLQLPVINRSVRLWTNPGETVFSPFGGVASEAYEAVKCGRKAVIIELKPDYWRVGTRNIDAAEASMKTGPNLLDLMNEDTTPPNDLAYFEGDSMNEYPAPSEVAA
jgi:DNA modification methylase